MEFASDKMLSDPPQISNLQVKAKRARHYGDVRPYRIGLTISLAINLCFLLVYIYSTAEGFLSLINTVIGFFD